MVPRVLHLLGKERTWGARGMVRVCGTIRVCGVSLAFSAGSRRSEQLPRTRQLKKMERAGAAAAPALFVCCHPGRPQPIVRIIFPMCVPSSMRRWASAAWASGNVLSMRTLTSPAASMGRMSASTLRAICAFTSAGRMRSVEPDLQLLEYLLHSSTAAAQARSNAANTSSVSASVMSNPGLTCRTLRSKPA